MKLPRLAPCLAPALVLTASLQACSSESGDPAFDGTGGTTSENGGAAATTGAGGGGGGGGAEGSTEGAIETGSLAGGNGRRDDHPPSHPGQPTLPECTSGLPTVPFYLSADDSNSMASPVIARERLLAGEAPDPARLRTYEFLNYYNVLYDLADPQQPDLGVFTDMVELGPSPHTGLPTFRLQIGVQAFQVPRVPLVLTFVVDSSGSLVGPGIERERAALLAITHQLEPGDIVNIVHWANEESVLLQSYAATGTEADDEVIAGAVNKLSPGGGSDLHAGLVKGYELANLHFDAAKLNRVVLLSDGGANLGELDRDVIAGAAAQANDEGIYLVGIGVGPAKGYSDTLMDLVTDAGRGAYVYLDGPEEADAVFTERFDEIMNVAARDVQVELRLPEYMQIEKFYGEEYAGTPDNIEPQNLAPGDSMVLNQVIYLAEPSLACGLDTMTVKVTWETPGTHDGREVSLPPVSLLDLLGKPPSHQMAKANAIIAYAEALKIDDAAELAGALTAVEQAQKLTEDADLAAIADLLGKHPRLSP